LPLSLLHAQQLIYHHSDLSEAFPNGELAARFREDWLTHMVKEVRTNRDYTDRTIQTARWAKDQIKRQTGM
jgi:importin subunit beta-1